MAGEEKAREIIPMRNAQVLVTGASGFVGHNLLYKKQPCDWIGTARKPATDAERTRLIFRRRQFSTYRPDKLQADEEWQGQKFCDLRDRTAVRSLLEQVKPQVVVHLAGKTGARDGEANPGEYFAVNAVGTANLLSEFADVCGSQGTLFIYASTSSVGVSGDDDLIGDSQQQTSIYGASKLAQEAVVSALSRQTGMTCLGLRLFTVYGPWGRPDMLIWRLLESCYAWGRQPVIIAGNGRAMRHFTHIEDVCRTITEICDRWSAAEYFTWEHEHHICDLGSGQAVRIPELMMYLCDSVRATQAGGPTFVLSGRGNPCEENYQRAPDQLTIKQLMDNPQVGASTSAEYGIRNFIKWFDSSQEAAQAMTADLRGISRPGQTEACQGAGLPSATGEPSGEASGEAASSEPSR